uniref:AlNc14C642G12327 protein n=1 Tax=Albugo laibachii Nc14 TaxID=890382 RepID=F0X1L6_9STRA|nr:AlNc14C642G12327 [Albugo laibachii Nc14]|eukprot:CCA27711.1 AlNc14C642G12327 [Albugo laibachii Nc14]
MRTSTLILLLPCVAAAPGEGTPKLRPMPARYGTCSKIEGTRTFSCDLCPSVVFQDRNCRFNCMEEIWEQKWDTGETTFYKKIWC